MFLRTHQKRIVDTKPHEYHFQLFDAVVVNDCEMMQLIPDVDIEDRGMLELPGCSVLVSPRVSEHSL